MKFVIALLLFCATAFGETAPGLAVTFTAGGATDATTWERVALYVPANQPATPFLPASPFKGTWSGFINVDLRSEYTFSVEHTGAARIVINGVVQDGKPVRLNKGSNAFSVEYESPADADAKIRLFWKPRKGMPQPLPETLFSHIPSDETRRGHQLRLGRELFIEHRCASCHQDVAVAKELKLDAPSFQGIGRLNQGWMRSWIANPRSHRPDARMPKLLSIEEADHVASYLASLSPEQAGSTFVSVDLGKRMVDQLNCRACHTLPTEESASGKISLREVRSKFSAHTLAELVANPAAHFESARMPRFKLSKHEAFSIELYLFTRASPVAGPANLSSNVKRGMELVQERGCLNCHSGELENKFAAPRLLEISGGCLAENPTNAPNYEFSTEQRQALAAFLATDRKSLTRIVPSESIERLSRNLNCRECHDKIEGLPRFDLLGAKLKPEWAYRFMEGKIEYKPRPWLEAQMPAYTKWAQELAEGLAARHGIGPITTEEPRGNLSEIGRKLVGINGGFSCVTCHAIGDHVTAQVTEAAGINFWWSAERLLPDFFHRWLANPLAIDPTTKMPVYFDEEGRSPLADILDGDGAQQRQALWDYLRQGREMKPPE